MEIFKEIPKLKNKTCVSIGKFDGVHLGHVTLLEELALTSELNECESVVFTFDPNPEDYFSGNELLHLNTKGEIISQMEEIGIDNLVRAPFDKVMNMSAEDFIKDIIVGRLKAKTVVCGSDVSFGKGGAGDAALLEKLSAKYGFETEIIEKIEYKGETISSSRIIKALEEGNIEDATEMLGYDYYHYGKVVRGEGLAHKYDIPTVNTWFFHPILQVLCLLCESKSGGLPYVLSPHCPFFQNCAYSSCKCWFLSTQKRHRRR